MVQDLLDGYNSLLFTYGVTNSGKTYTVLVCYSKRARDWRRRRGRRGRRRIRRMWRNSPRPDVDQRMHQKRLKMGMFLTRIKDTFLIHLLPYFQLLNLLFSSFSFDYDWLWRARLPPKRLASYHARSTSSSIARRLKWPLKHSFGE